MNPFRRFWKSAPRPDAAQLHPIRAEVLIIEDDGEQRALLYDLLRMQSAIVTQASNIAGALQALDGGTKFQLAFIDLRLPNGQGSEIVRRIKERHRGTHVVLLSGDPERILQALEWGPVIVLTKPYSISAIREILNMMRLPVND